LKEVSSTINPAEARKKAYEIVGHHVVNHCDVLIALWDGRPSRGRGGTAEIVAYAREKKCPMLIISP
jgi:CTP synthase (UTP-ammonia lyase)